MDIKKSGNHTDQSIVTRDIRKFDANTGNIYEAVSIISKRANQISSEIKEELSNKLQEFSGHTDNLERRLTEHNSGKTRFTSQQGSPWILKYSEEFSTRAPVISQRESAGVRNPKKDQYA